LLSPPFNFIDDRNIAKTGVKIMPIGIPTTRTLLGDARTSHQRTSTPSDAELQSALTEFSDYLMTFFLTI